MSLLCRIPEAVFLSFLCNWGNVADWAKLDTAFSNRKERREILTAFHSPSFTVLGEFRFCESAGFINWLAYRGIKLSTLSCNFNSIFCQNIHETNLCFSKLKSLTFCDNKRTRLIAHNFPISELINSCVYLESLHLVDFLMLPSDVDNLDIDILGNLVSLTLTVHTQSDFSTISFLSLCHSLRSAVLEIYCENVSSFDAVKCLLTHNVNLTEITCQFIELSLDNTEWILTNYPNLQLLYVQICCERHDRNRLAMLSRRYPQLSFRYTFNLLELRYHGCDQCMILTSFKKNDLTSWLTEFTDLKEIHLMSNLDYFVTETAEFIVENNPNLTIFEISTSRYTIFDALQKIVMLPRLVSSSVSALLMNTVYGEFKFIELLDVENSIEHLSLVNISIVNSVVIIAFLKSNPQLRTIHVVFHSDHEENVNQVKEYLVSIGSAVILTHERKG